MTEPTDQPIRLQPSGLSMGISLSLAVVVFSLPLCFAELAQRSDAGILSLHGLIVVGTAAVSVACLVGLGVGLARFRRVRPGRLEATKAAFTVRARNATEDRVLERDRVAGIRYEWRPENRDDVDGSFLTFIGHDGKVLCGFAFEPLVTERDMSRWMRRAAVAGEIRTRRHAAMEAGAGA